MNRTMFAAVALVGQLLVPALSGAQPTGAITSYELRFYQGGASPVSVYTFDVADVVCNQDPLPPPVHPVNPRLVEWDDPDAAGRSCLHDTTTSGSLIGLPVGTYDAALVATNAVGDSPESGRSNPFSRMDPRAAPTGLALGP